MQPTQHPIQGLIYRQLLLGYRFIHWMISRKLGKLGFDKKDRDDLARIFITVQLEKMLERIKEKNK